MRSVNYVLANGTKTTSYEVAKASKMPYGVKVEAIDPHRTPMSETRKQKISEYFKQKSLDRLVTKCYNQFSKQLREIKKSLRNILKSA